METSTSAALATSARAPAPPRREVVGAWLLLVGAGTVWLALAWDSEWHVDVGPDTFFTAPHSMMYVGVALMGLTSLAIVLLNTWRAGPRSGNRAVTVLGTFRAPIPFLISGLGAAAFLLYGIADLWWHTIYGFDLAGTSWPHAGLLLGQLLQTVGVVVAFATLVSRRSTRWGLITACALSVATSMPAFGSIVELLPGVELLAVLMAGVSALALGVVAGLTRSPRWLLATGLAFLAVQLVTFLFAPFATRVYADILGLSMREIAASLSFIAIQLPATFPIAAIAAAALIWCARRRSAPATGTIAVIGAISGTGVALWYVLFGVVVGANADLLVSIAALVTAAVFGAVAGWFGSHCAVLLRRLAPQEVS